MRPSSRPGSSEAFHLAYGAFFKGVWDLVDTWTETAEEQEYVDMVRALLRGVSSDGGYRGDKDITYNNAFSVGHAGDGDHDGEDDDDEFENGEDEANVGGNDHTASSVLHPLAVGKNKNKNNKRGFNLISAAVLEKVIAEIYQVPCFWR